MRETPGLSHLGGQMKQPCACEKVINPNRVNVTDGLTGIPFCPMQSPVGPIQSPP